MQHSNCYSNVKNIDHVLQVQIWGYLMVKLDQIGL